MAGIVKRGRPPKPPRLRRSHRLQLMLTTAEHKALKAYAARQGLDVSETVRDCMRRLLSDEPGTSSPKKGERR